ncbi:TPA: hypothetical protein N0F65_008644 [Lagenidium giganteum]|uniref:Uncharacterized protein n=1 Tax=Lagenidium giganteum TaxID=4803 RepID=A0AAV2Z941_9STRA|nr:TPA: hypothetical protein N0F65_008644 [Lagenidium giganteum]
MKRKKVVPITAFFQRKATKKEEDRPDSAADVAEEIDEEDEPEPQSEIVNVTPPAAPATLNNRRHSPVHLVHILRNREIGTRCRRRWKEQLQRLQRWVLTQFQISPIVARLDDQWEQRAGFLSRAAFYASSMAFDSQGALLIVGASNGIIALYDFDDYFFKSMNLAQIHTIFTNFEIKRVCWNPFNEDEIACSFSNLNEIWLFNLQKFPSRPYRVLKATSRPSSGYNDIVFLRTPSPSIPPKGNLKAKLSYRLIGADMDGSVRLWDSGFPNKPMWSVSTGSHPVNCMVLSQDEQHLVCGTESGLLVFFQTFDIQNVVVPAFGSRPVPQRHHAFHVLDLVKRKQRFETTNACVAGFLSTEHIAWLSYGPQGSAPGIVSLTLSPFSKSEVICQFRNAWIVLIDFTTGKVSKLHTFVTQVEELIAFVARYLNQALPRTDVPASVLVTGIEDSQRQTSRQADRGSWLGSHRCTGAMLFHGSFFCTGVHHDSDLHVVDLEQRLVDRSRALPPPTLTPFDPNQPIIERLDRFRIEVGGDVTAVCAHPTRHLLVCGGENMQLTVLGAFGRRSSPAPEPVPSQGTPGSE